MSHHLHYVNLESGAICVWCREKHWGVCEMPVLNSEDLFRFSTSDQAPIIDVLVVLKIVPHRLAF